MKAGRGRPSKPAGERRTAKIELRVTEAEKQRFRIAAGSAGLSAWLLALAVGASEGVE